MSSRLVVFCLAGTGVLLAAAGGGRFLYAEDPLQRSDAILVFSGTLAERPLEARDLYQNGYAPIIVLTHVPPDGGQQWLAGHGITVPDSTDLARDLLLRLGVPAAAVVVPSGVNDSTADEARTFASLIRVRHWHRVIGVTTKMHARRAGMALRRQVKDAGVEVLMRASRYDPADPVHWWRRRADARTFLIEMEKYAAYWIGVMQ